MIYKLASLIRFLINGTALAQLIAKEPFLSKSKLSISYTGTGTGTDYNIDDKIFEGVPVSTLLQCIYKFNI